jgi:hypothetical protein
LIQSEHFHLKSSLVVTPCGYTQLLAIVWDCVH